MTDLTKLTKFCPEVGQVCQLGHSRFYIKEVGIPVYRYSAIPFKTLPRDVKLVLQLEKRSIKRSAI